MGLGYARREEPVGVNVEFYTGIDSASTSDHAAADAAASTCRAAVLIADDVADTGKTRVVRDFAPTRSPRPDRGDLREAVDGVSRLRLAHTEAWIDFPGRRRPLSSVGRCRDRPRRRARPRPRAAGVVREGESWAAAARRTCASMHAEPEPVDLSGRGQAVRGRPRQPDRDPGDDPRRPARRGRAGGPDRGTSALVDAGRAEPTADAIEAQVRPRASTG